MRRFRLKQMKITEWQLRRERSKQSFADVFAARVFAGDAVVGYLVAEGDKADKALFQKIAHALGKIQLVHFDQIENGAQWLVVLGDLVLVEGIEAGDIVSTHSLKAMRQQPALKGEVWHVIKRVKPAAS